MFKYKIKDFKMRFYSSEFIIVVPRKRDFISNKKCFAQNFIWVPSLYV